jgi:pantetheine-phosphate adenylyltransferase
MATPASGSTVGELKRGVALCPGTYDPVTFGHLDIISRAAGVFERVVVAVVNKPVRKGSRTVFSTEERIGFIQGEVKSLENVEVKSFDNLLVKFARENGATAIVKGLRAISDFEYELEMNQLNRTMDPEIESIYLMSSPNYSFLSSSGVKELAMFGGDLSQLVPATVAKRLKEELQR